MKTRALGKTGLQLPILSFGASSLGAEFRNVTLDEVLKSVRVALDCGLNFIDTSPFYGRGMSEVLLGIALRDVPRDRFTLCTKLGRYDLNHFDFSAWNNRERTSAADGKAHGSPSARTFDASSDAESQRGCIRNIDWPHACRGRSRIVG
jgi:aryl-alcohol dehydrogenase-like predicted oxidoreductase